MSIITRAGKGSALTHNEMDTNLTDLRDGLNMMVPKGASDGVKVDSLGSPSFGWRNLHGELILATTGPSQPTWAVYTDGIRQLQFDANDEATLVFTFPHDYVLGTDYSVAVMWSHNSTLVTGGTLTFGYDRVYSKAYGQAAFGAMQTLLLPSSAMTTQYGLQVAEAVSSTPGGSSSLIDTALLEPDGVLIGRIYVDANNITVSSGGAPDPFIHRVVLQYQSKSVGTKNSSPPFYGA